MFFIDKFTSQLYIYFGFPFGKLFVLFGGLVKQPPIFFNKTLPALLLRQHTTKLRELNYPLLSFSFLRKVRSKKFLMDRTFFSFCLPKTHCYKIWLFYIVIFSWFFLQSLSRKKKSTRLRLFLNFLRESLLISAAVDIILPLSHSSFAAVVGKADGLWRGSRL